MKLGNKGGTEERKKVGFKMKPSLISRLKHYLADYGGTQSEFVELAVEKLLEEKG